MHNPDEILADVKKHITAKEVEDNESIILSESDVESPVTNTNSMAATLLMRRARKSEQGEGQIKKETQS